MQRLCSWGGEEIDVESAPEDVVVEIDVKTDDESVKKQSFLVKVVKAIEEFFVGLFT